ncbi:hypothetical protein AADEFJLK_03596 [Methylovulum psychrotolerans]|uniref:Uncharacterized protein n=1 Tax=Methylovulum psychrotolerans TaxID=1704499 RepID=A0A2S5CIS9_9GAMM|nr:hypothetical protein AADEFJLK_03596 [Methylovulum psychrotolerans]
MFAGKRHQTGCGNGKLAGEAKQYALGQITGSPRPLKTVLAQLAEKWGAWSVSAPSNDRVPFSEKAARVNPVRFGDMGYYGSHSFLFTRNSASSPESFINVSNLAMSASGYKTPAI